jgi:hypothetical protein
VSNGQCENPRSECKIETRRRLDWLPHIEGFERRKASIEVPLLRLLPGLAANVVNSKTNDPEEAYRQLLDARRATSEGVRLLPSEVSRIRHDDLRAILLDYYREHKPRSIIKRHTGYTDSAGNKLTEEVFAVRYAR